MIDEFARYQLRLILLFCFSHAGKLFAVIVIIIHSRVYNYLFSFTENYTQIVGLFISLELERVNFQLQRGRNTRAYCL